MPFLAETNEKVVTPADVHDEFQEGDTLTCPDCGGDLRWNKKGVQEDGTLHYRAHFSHPKTDQDTGEQSVTDCEYREGNPSPHAEMKEKAVKALKDTYSVDSVKLEHGIGNRDADVVGEFEIPHPEYGDGIAIEVQYENTGKNYLDVTETYVNNNYSVFWVFLITDNDYNAVYEARNSLRCVFESSVFFPSVGTYDEVPDLSGSKPITPSTPTYDIVDLTCSDPVQYAIGWGTYYLEHSRESRYSIDVPESLVDQITAGIRNHLNVDYGDLLYRYSQQADRFDGNLHSARRFLALSLIEEFGGHDSGKPNATPVLNELWTDVREALPEKSDRLQHCHNTYKCVLKETISKQLECAVEYKESPSLPVSTAGEDLPRCDMYFELGETDDQLGEGIVVDVRSEDWRRFDSFSETNADYVYELVTSGYTYLWLPISYRGMDFRSRVPDDIRVRAVDSTRKFLRMIHEWGSWFTESVDIPWDETPYEAENEAQTIAIETGSIPEISASLPPEWVEKQIRDVWERSDWEKLVWSRKEVGDGNEKINGLYDYEEYGLAEYEEMVAGLDDLHAGISAAEELNTSHPYRRGLERTMNRCGVSFAPSVPASFHICKWLTDDRQMYELDSYTRVSNPQVLEKDVLVPQSLTSKIQSLAEYQKTLKNMTERLSTRYDHEVQAMEIAISDRDPDIVTVPATFQLPSWLTQSNSVYNIAKDKPVHVSSIDSFGDDILIPDALKAKIADGFSVHDVPLNKTANHPSITGEVIQCWRCGYYYSASDHPDGGYWSRKPTSNRCNRCGQRIDIRWNIGTGRVSKQTVLKHSDLDSLPNEISDTEYVQGCKLIGEVLDALDRGDFVQARSDASEAEEIFGLLTGQIELMRSRAQRFRQEKPLRLLSDSHEHVEILQTMMKRAADINNPPSDDFTKVETRIVDLRHKAGEYDMYEPQDINYVFHILE